MLRVLEQTPMPYSVRDLRSTQTVLSKIQAFLDDRPVGW